MTLSRRSLLQSLLILAACGDDGSNDPPAAGAGAGGAGGGTGGGAGAGGAGSGGAGSGGAGSGGAGGAGKAGAEQGGAGQGGKGGAGPAGAFPYDVWAELREAVRKSPDHLAHEAQRLVEKKDAAAIFAFVQRSFATRPLLDFSLSANPTSRQGWGKRGLLRSGSGTPRDKADLLSDLLTQAGFEASVVAGPVDAKSYWPRVMGHTPQREFKPAITAEQLDQIRAKLGLAAPASVEVVDAKGEAAAKLADTLLGLLPAERKALDLPAFDATSAPFVKVKVGGKTLICDANDPESTFEQGPPDSGLSDPGPAVEPSIKLGVTLSALMTTSTKPVDLVSTEYKIADVVGRTLSVALVPPGGLDAVLLSSLRDVRTFRPHLVVSGPEISHEERDKLVVAGDGFTVGGDIIKATESTIEVNGLPLDPSTGPADPALVAKVASLSLSVSSSSFPQIRLRAAALDKDGLPVAGLPASAFALSEGGKRAGAALTENRSRPPRVMFVLDKSDSIPADFKGEPAAAALRDVAAAVKAQVPGAQFNVFAVSSTPEQKNWTDDPEKLYQSALAASPIFGSDLWDAMAKASDESPSFVVLFTDGDSTDEPSLQSSVRVQRIPASLALKVGSFDPAKLVALTKASNGEVLPVDAVDKAKQAMVDALKKAEKSVYALNYRADEAGPSTRAVALKVGSAQADATYEVPAPEARLTPPRLAGLFLTIKQGNEEVTRRIAGAARVEEPLAPGALDEAALACFGTIELRLEGEPPTASALVDELLSARLSSEPFVAAARSGDVAAALDALEAGWERPEGIALALASVGASAASGPVTGSGLRGVLTTLLPTLGNQVIQRSDVLLIGPLRGLAADRKAAFDEALRGSMRLALAEQALHLDSTLERIKGETLVYLAPYQSVDSLFPALPAEQKKAWNTLLNGYNPYHRALPSSGALLGFFAVHEKTGSTLAVLPDGTGGSATKAQIEAEMNWMISVLNWASAVGGYFGVIGLVGGAWLSFEKAKLKKIIQATIAISTLDAPPGADGFQDSIKDVACDILKGLAGEAFGRLVEQGIPALQALGILGAATIQSDAFIEAGLGKAPIECF